jgi:carbonic anhydrase
MIDHNAHGCNAVIIECIDYRFRFYIDDWLTKNFKEKGEKYDLISLAGSTKELDTVINQIDISVSLHHINQVVLIHHEECGAYGTDSTPERHREDLLKAKEKITEKYSNLNVAMYYLQLDGTFNEIA